MERLVIILIIYILVLFIDMLPIFKNKDKVINTVYVVIYFFTFVVLLLDEFGIPIPSPSILIKNMINSVMK